MPLWYPSTNPVRRTLLQAADADGALVLPLINMTGDHPVFGQLVQRHERQVMAIAYRMTGSLEDAQDAAQETFLRLHSNLAGFRDPSLITAWLRRVVVN